MDIPTGDMQCARVGARPTIPRCDVMRERYAASNGVPRAPEVVLDAGSSPALGFMRDDDQSNQ